ncbi:uncharacterized protein LOC142318134 [Lycorma delicatula]|uniref:uncharacterized protein LOC142318134 n=1 Tax=Lycorma delicatula TaxID=130591 RepID=UPI003F50D78A
MPKCGVCNKNITTKHSKIACIDCKTLFHASCENMSKDDIELLIFNNEIWRCEHCALSKRKDLQLETAVQRNNFTLDDVMSAINELKRAQKRMISDMNESSDLLHKKIDDNSKIIADQTLKLVEYVQKIENLTAKNHNLRQQVKQLEFRLEDVEQYSRKSMIEIHGIPKKDDEDVVDTIKKVGDVIGFQITDEMIDACHRLPGKNNMSDGIIVKFVRRRDKENFMKKKRDKKLITTLNMGFTTDTPVYINESLCPPRRRLYALARQAKKYKGYKYIWLRDGKILMRKNEKDKIVQIRNEEDLNKLP